MAGTGLGATLVACGDDDVAGTSSGSVPEGGNPVDSPVGDTSSPVDAADGAPKPNFAKLTFINATTDMGAGAALNVRGDAAIRICFKQGTTAQNLGVAPYPPLPDKPKGTQTVAGVLYGTGGSFPSFGLDLEGRIIVPIIMNVKSLVVRGIKNPGTGQPGTTCDELVGDTADAAANLVENVDYWVLPQIDAGTFKKEKSYVLALTGCVGDSARAPGTECGPGFTPGGAAGVGNLKVTIFETNTTPVSATQLGAQVFHVSAQANAFFAGGTIPFTPGFTADPTDAGPSFRAATAAPIELDKLSTVQGAAVKDTDFFVLDKATPGNPLRALAPFPLPTIQALSGLGLPTAPTVYTNGKNFVFVVVGDPTQPTFSATDGGGPGDGGDGTSFNTQSLHYIAFPTDPVIEPYKP